MMCSNFQAMDWPTTVVHSCLIISPLNIQLNENTSIPLAVFSDPLTLHESRVQLRRPLTWPRKASGFMSSTTSVTLSQNKILFQSRSYSAVH